MYYLSDCRIVKKNVLNSSRAGPLPKKQYFNDQTSESWFWEMAWADPTHSIFFINCMWRYKQKEIKNWIKCSCFFWQEISIIISEIIAVRYRSLLCKYLLISGVLQTFANHQLGLFSIFIIGLVLLYKKFFWLPKPLKFQSWQNKKGYYLTEINRTKLIFMCQTAPF